MGKISVVVPIVTALVGAVAAAGIAQYLRRSRPALIIDELSRSADLVPYSAAAVVNTELVSALQDTEFIAPPTFGDRVSETDYIASMKVALDEVEVAIESLPEVTRVAGTLSDCLQREDYDDFKAHFARETRRIWFVLLGACVRGKFDYEGPAPAPLREPTTDPSMESDDDFVTGSDDPESGTVSIAPSLSDYPGVFTEGSPEAASVKFWHPNWVEEVVRDKEGDFWIPLAGPLSLVFQWTSGPNPSQLLNARTFAMRTAVAFASSHLTDLRAIANYLLTVERTNRPVLEDLRRRLGNEVREYERVVVKGFVANRGGSAVTVTNSGRLFVGLLGYSFADEQRNLRSLASDQQVDMYIGADKGEGNPAFGAAITVEAGAVSRFVATSKKRLQDLPECAVLARALDGGERTCYLGTMVVSQRHRFSRQPRSRSQFKPTYTAPQPFRDSASQVHVPERHGLIARISRGRRANRV